MENLTAEEVALAAGVSRRTFYRYFPTVEHALCALLRRSVMRLSENLLKRPKSENIFQAMIAVARTVAPTPQELEIQKLAHRVAERSPGAWWQALNNVGVSASEGMEPVVAARLAATGEDVSRAGLITALWLGIVKVIGRANFERGVFAPGPDILERTLRDLSAYMHACLED
jgi:AcrR family transcriptional regulator